MRRRTPEVGLLNSHVVRGQDGGLVYVGMSLKAARLAFSHASAWFWFRQARRSGNFDGMLTAELHAQAVRGLLIARLHEEGFEDGEINTLLERHRRNDSGDSERHEGTGAGRGYQITLGAMHPPVTFRSRSRHW